MRTHEWRIERQNQLETRYVRTCKQGSHILYSEPQRPFSNMMLLQMTFRRAFQSEDTNACPSSSFYHMVLLMLCLKNAFQWPKLNPTQKVLSWLPAPRCWDLRFLQILDGRKGLRIAGKTKFEIEPPLSVFSETAPMPRMCRRKKEYFLSNCRFIRSGSIIGTQLDLKLFVLMIVIVSRASNRNDLSNNDFRDANKNNA